MSNPWALLGLLGIAVPIVIHLLGRHRSRIEKFPTLRFIGTSRLNPTKRRRISDWPLLLVRIAIIAAAAFALSQPLFHHSASSASDLTRVVIVDTSASVSRAAADTLTGERVTTDSPEDAIPGAIAWLATRPGRREIVLVSDFQRSSIDTSSLAAIPKDVGISVVLSPAKDLLLANKQVLRGVYPERSRGAQDDIGVFAGPADLAGADAAWRAIGRSRPGDTTGRIAIIYRSSPAAASLSRSATPVDSIWMAKVVTELRRDRTLVAAGRADRSGALAGGDLDRITERLVAGRVGGRLLLFLSADAGGITSAALNDALVRARSPGVPASELDSTRWSAEQLARWQRAPLAAPGAAGDASDARWIWMLCLALIALETWMRSRTRGSAGIAELPEAQDRAA